MYFRASILLLFFLSFPKPSIAQTEVDYQHLVWYGLFFTVPVARDWTVFSQIQERHFISPFAQHQLSVKSRIQKKIGNGWSASTGIGYLLQSPDNPRSGSNSVEREFRIDVEGGYEKNFEKLTLDQRLRVETRLFPKEIQEEPVLDEVDYFNSFRFRYRVLTYYLIWQISADQEMKVLAGDEVMFQAGKTPNYSFDQNRLMLGVDLKMSAKLKLELTYQKWVDKRQSGNYYNRNVVRLTANYQLLER
ncbi:DUF2490 domain-containing protein [Algoriphagus sp. AGSA1]|uniref:DUF2490 domain-containing protein n=1 Tax=Algoriphagus sp. AGSA1 TaxID=2907213 RepID=UPI001F3EEFAB|nr:DUF2490 domain-containing protein [Algoriphagus sp. AGSA1]MCE7055895.1 DUF2490 domain-containing protein [Algoriphagus sp. AGSA1]